MSFMYETTSIIQRFILLKSFQYHEINSKKQLKKNRLCYLLIPFDDGF